MQEHRAWYLAAVIVAFCGSPPAEAQSVRDCTAAERSAADKQLWLNKRDKNAAIRQHLPIGVPQSKTAVSGERLLVQRDYVIQYDEDLLVPLWTAHHIEAKALRQSSRVDCFRRDPRLNSPAASLLSDYNEEIYDQGHLTPSSDMSSSLNAVINSFILSNMTPQHCQFNRGVWQIYESIVRLWATQRGSIYIITGSLFDRDGNRRRKRCNAMPLPCWAGGRAKGLICRSHRRRPFQPTQWCDLLFVWSGNMAKVATPKESANLILQRFKINHLRAGEMLLTGPLMMVFQQEGFSGEDLLKGLDYAREQNWIEIDGTKVFLTDQGFAEM